ncbi:MAG: HAD-IIB family hydrolase [Termitinemataceae bacterium]|nr:MAG: HAD-IIB family hydrolase [Termitinemataceae bacterium]
MTETKMNPISAMTRAEANGIKFVLMDIDDTITLGGKLLASSYTALWKLHDAGITVIPVTGRPAAWCSLIARQWPVDAVIGENGALVFWEERDDAALNLTGGKPHLKTFFHPNAVRNDSPILTKIKERCFDEVPGIRLANDQFARMFDIALDFAEEDPVLSLSAAEKVQKIALEEGAQAKISSIHVNVWLGNYDKVTMAELLLQRLSGKLIEVLFVGDSPNDEPMFRRFPLACAVANINKYSAYITHLPAFVATRECADGFAEITDTLLALRA